VAGHEGERYLVSMLGECEWVKNVRAQGEAHLNSGLRRKVRLEEVPVEDRVRSRPIQHVPLHYAPAGDSRVLDNAPGAMLFAILPADFAAQELDGRQLSAHWRR